MCSLLCTKNRSQTLTAAMSPCSLSWDYKCALLLLKLAETLLTKGQSCFLTHLCRELSIKGQLNYSVFLLENFKEKESQTYNANVTKFEWWILEVILCRRFGINSSCLSSTLQDIPNTTIRTTDAKKKKTHQCYNLIIAIFYLRCTMHDINSPVHIFNLEGLKE